MEAVNLEEGHQNGIFTPVSSRLGASWGARQMTSPRAQYFVESELFMYVAQKPFHTEASTNMSTSGLETRDHVSC